MSSFGSFETEREVYSDLIYTVYTARKLDDSSGQYAVKVFRLPDHGLEAEVTGGPAGREELESARLHSIDVQQQAAAQSLFVAPILERGSDSRGLWYATRFYPRSVNIMMSGKVALPRASLEHIIFCIARGALDLKRVCGRSHGDIQPTKVQVSKSEKLTEAEVVLSDPLPGDATQAEAYELSDLRAIGWILLQLVRQRALSKDDLGLMFPISPDAEWTRVFGSDASDWLALCNRLLDPNLSVSQFPLETLVARLEELQPKRRGSTKLVGALCGLAVLLLVGGFVLFRPHPKNLDTTSRPVLADAVTNRQKVQVTAPPFQTQVAKSVEVPPAPPTNTPVPPVIPTGEIEFSSQPFAATVFDANGKELGRTAPGTTLIRTVPTGKAVFTAKAQGFKDVPIELIIEPGVRTERAFIFDYGTVVWTSEPVPATVQSSSQSTTTPASFIQASETTNEYVITAPGYQTQTKAVSVRNGEKRALIAHLVPLTAPVALVSDPPGAEFLSEDGTPFIRDKNNDRLFLVPSGLKKIVARHPQLGLMTNQLQEPSPGASSQLGFNFLYGRLILTNLPTDVTLYEAETRVGLASDGSVVQRPGVHRYVLRGPSTSQEVQLNIQPGLNYLRLATSEKTWKNSQGMLFAWVPNLPGGGLWSGQNEPGGWVGISEVTQGQYKKMDGSNPSVYRDVGDNYPVENVTWAQAMKYCRWLSAITAAESGGWHYTLPTDEQFTAFAADAERVARVTAEGHMNSAPDDGFLSPRLPRIPAAQNLNNARTHPEQVASTKQANQYGLYDVIGNVSEWLASPSGKENVYAGGSYLNFSQKALGIRSREHNLQKGPNIGFRVILLPAQ